MCGLCLLAAKRGQGNTNLSSSFSLVHSDNHGRKVMFGRFVCDWKVDRFYVEFEDSTKP